MIGVDTAVFHGYVNCGATGAITGIGNVLPREVLHLCALSQAAAKGDGTEDRRSTFVETFCPECENMLLPNSSFCVVCGTSVRSSSRQARRAMGMGTAHATTASAPTDGGVA